MRSNNIPQIKIIPDNYTSVTPWIISPSSAKLMEFLKAAFDAEEIPNSRIMNAGDAIIHVVVKIGNARIMLFDSRSGWGSTPAFLNLYVDDVELVYQKALALGAKSATEITARYFGEKVCRLLDPFGNLWWINQRIPHIDFTKPGELERRTSVPQAVAGIAYIQQSVDEALKIQKEFFETEAA
ncbi:VOC family protein [Mucilaginibacter flavus]|uniref:VOC family protein n=1 Tax=Mucilaginibacter flavus TaxID=931504 RepID=UPI0025B3D996|nr:VOC family protein [Mucilaginibacter flavus]MDN3581348.1 VOC family protein [Mucilaginibacter flavus]